jgi:MFS family permease
LVIFFIASAGASSAYLTVSEIFPMETRALSIAFFFAVGTAAGGITGPLLFGHLIASGSESQVAVGFFIGAAVMTLGGVAELFFGVGAEQEQLEDVAEPLTAEGVEEPQRPSPPQRRFRPGPARIGSPGMPVSAPLPPAAFVRELDMIDHALQDRGSANRHELARRVGARYWGPGRFRAALRAAVDQGRVKRLRGGEYAPVPPREVGAGPPPHPG